MRAEDRLRPYVPGFAVEWLRTSPASRHRSVDGTLAFVDVSGFTRLTERLAVRGKVGAEEMTGILDRTFAELLAVAYSHGAWLVKWGGDAVLLLFQGDGHAERATTAAVGMRRAMDVVGRVHTDSGPVRLRISTGLHSGFFDFFLVGSSHRELVITGPGPSTTAAMEAAAAAGQVAVSPQTAALLPAGVVRARPDGVLLVVRPPAVQPRPPVRSEPVPDDVDLRTCLPAATREYLLAGEDEAEHRLVSVAFVEFSGVDALLTEQGPGATTSAVDAVIVACQEACTRHGVTFWETDISKDGGKVMLVAGVPSTRGSDEDAMLAVARDVVDYDGVLPVRVGVNSGRVFFGQFGPPYRRTMSVKGDAVNLAARLMGKAATGEVLAAVQVVARARTPFAAQSLPPFTVKGKTQLIYACRVGPVRATADDDGDSTAVFVGRSAELARLQEHWQIACAGHLEVHELVGEPGVGKSRLVGELLSDVAGRVLEVRADRYTSTSAYASLRRLLREVLAVPAGGDPPTAGRRLLVVLLQAAPELLPFAPLVAAVLDAEVPATPESSAVDERFRAQRQEEVVADLLVRLLPDPAVVVVDDAHLLDPASVSLLRRLIVRAASAPWLLLVCRREETQVLPLEGVAGVTTTLLAPLDGSASLELVRALTEAAPLPPHDVAVLLRRAAGNPLFLGELAAAAASGSRVHDLPDNVELVVAARIDAIDRVDRALLRAAAVLGTDVLPRTLEVLAARAGIEVRPGALARLSPFFAANADGTFRFRHALVRETAYEGLPYSRRTLLHGHVGDVLGEGAGPEADAVLSLHFLHAQRHADAWRAARRAGDRARTRNAPAEAAELYERALHAARHLDGLDAEMTDVRELLGDVRYRLADFSGAVAAYRDGRRGAADEDCARLHHKTAVALDRQGAFRRALWELSVAERLAAAARDTDRLRAQIRTARAAVRHWQGRSREALAECLRAIAAAERSGDLAVLADALVWLDAVQLRLGVDDPTRPAERALELWHRLGDQPWHEARTLNALGIRAYYAGRWEEALRWYASSAQACERAGDAFTRATETANMAEILSDQGRLTEAQPLLQDAMHVWRAAHAPSFVAFGASQLGRLHARAGRYAEAEESLREARHGYAQAGEEAELLEVDARQAECLVLQGRGAEALDVARPALERAVVQAPALVPLLERVEGLARAQAGDAAGGAEALERSLASARLRSAEHEVVFTAHELVRLQERLDGAVDGAVARQEQVLLERFGIIRIAEAPLPAAGRAAARRAVLT